MAKPANYPLNVRIGDTETVTVTLQNADGTYVDITDRIYNAQIRAKASDSNALATFTCSILDAEAGKFSCVLSADTTEHLSQLNAVWDLQEYNNGVITTLLAGTATISRDVTR